MPTKRCVAWICSSVPYRSSPLKKPSGLFGSRESDAVFVNFIEILLEQRRQRELINRRLENDRKQPRVRRNAGRLRGTLRKPIPAGNRTSPGGFAELVDARHASAKRNRTVSSRIYAGFAERLGRASGSGDRRNGGPNVTIYEKEAVAAQHAKRFMRT